MVTSHLIRARVSEGAAQEMPGGHDDVGGGGLELRWVWVRVQGVRGRDRAGMGGMGGGGASGAVAVA